MKKSNFFNSLTLVIFLLVVSFKANAQCAASFTYIDNGSGNYSFTSTSTNYLGTNFYWYFSNNITGTNGPNSVMNNSFVNGTYMVYLYIEDTANNCSDLATQLITVTSGQTPICNANFVEIPNNVTNKVDVYNYSTGVNLTYFWDFGDGNNSTLQFPSHTYLIAGSYNVSLTVDNGTNCQDVYTSLVANAGVVIKQAGFDLNVLDPNTVGIKENKLHYINAYPNPTKNKVTVAIKNISGTFNYSLTSIDGRLIESKQKLFNNSLIIDLSNEKSGIYFLKIELDGAVYVQKIIKQ